MSVKYDGFFLAVFVFRVLSYSYNKVEVDSFGFAVLFYEERAVGYLSDNAVKDCSVVEGGNYTFLVNKSFCQLFHFVFVSVSFSFNGFLCNYSFAVS